MWPETPPKKFIVWGHPLYSHTHSYIHYGYTKAAKALGWDTEWHTNTPMVGSENTNGYLFFTEGQVCSNIPINPNAFYILHNCDAAKFSSIPDSNKLILQVFTVDVYDRDVKELKEHSFEFWQENANTLYAPWATDLLPSEIDENIERVLAFKGTKNENGVFLGSVGGGYHGNIDEINRFRDGLQRHGRSLVLLSSTHIGQSDSIKMLQDYQIAPSIVGGWQKRQGYIPCRIFKTISYGLLGVTNSSQAYEVVGKHAVYHSDETVLASQAIERLATHTPEAQAEAMRYVRDNHTFLNRLDTFQKVFKVKNGTLIQ